MKNKRLQLNKQYNMPLLGRGRKKLWSYLSLIFSIFYLLPLFFTEKLPQSHLIIAMVIYFGFLSTYIIAINSGPIYRNYLIFLLMAVCFAAVPFNLGGLSLLGYCFFLIAYYWSTRDSVLTAVALMISMLALPMLMSSFIWQYIVPVVVSSVVLYLFGFMEKKETLHTIALQKSHESVKKLSAIAERERIGRDLHDIAGHGLSSISLKAQLASKLLQKNQINKAQDEVDQLAELATNLLSEIRKAVSEIKHLHIADEINKLENVLNENTIVLHKQIDEQALTLLSATSESALSLILKEAITNILRHSNATKVNLKIATNKKLISMLLQDNGEINTSQTRYTGNGIKGMQERIELVGGSFAIDFVDGCRIDISVPL